MMLFICAQAVSILFLLALHCSAKLIGTICAAQMLTLMLLIIVQARDPSELSEELISLDFSSLSTASSVNYPIKCWKPALWSFIIELAIVFPIGILYSLSIIIDNIQRKRRSI